MSVKALVRRQYQELVDRAAQAPIQHTPLAPSEGWIATVRKAIGMSGSQLAKRLDVTRARISAVEKAETNGAVTLQTMNDIAKAMDCNFVYAIVPNTETAEIIRTQALRKAEALVTRAANHMALERQSLSNTQNKKQIEIIAEELVRTMPADLWSESKRGR